MVKLTLFVLDKATKVPIPYTYVELNGLVLTTDIRGGVTFEVIPCRTYVLKVRHAFYRPYSTRVHAPEVDTAYRVEIERIIF